MFDFINNLDKDTFKPLMIDYDEFKSIVDKEAEHAKQRYNENKGKNASYIAVYWRTIDGEKDGLDRVEPVKNKDGELLPRSTGKKWAAENLSGADEIHYPVVVMSTGIADCTLVENKDDTDPKDVTAFIMSTIVAGQGATFVLLWNLSKNGERAIGKPQRFRQAADAGVPVPSVYFLEGCFLAGLEKVTLMSMDTKDELPS